MRRRFVLFIFGFVGFLLGVAAYEVVTNLPSGNVPPLNPEFVGAFLSGLAGSIIMLLAVLLFVRMRAR